MIRLKNLPSVYIHLFSMENLSNKTFEILVVKQYTETMHSLNHQ